ncbi:MAG: universal stress protein [Pseudomonadota bacterium]
MSFRTLMVPFLNVQSAQGTFALAASAARVFGAHIEATHLRQHPPIPANVYQPFPYAYVPVDVAEIEEAAQKAADELKAAFEQLCAAHDVSVGPAPNPSPAAAASASWLEVKGDFPKGYAQAARCCDLSVMTRFSEDTPRFEIDVLEELLFNSGRPVLIGDGAFQSLTNTVLIAWDGGREAARAVTAATPALMAAARVIVATVGPVSASLATAERLAERLRRCGVAAEAHEVTVEPGEKPEARLISYAHNLATELIVMGAYSHSRLRELVLGGFTKRLLSEPSIPLLLAH